MGLFYENYSLGSIIALILFVAVWIVINEVTRKSKMLSILAYCILPVVLAILVFTNVLSSPTGKTWFAWVKVVSALTGVLGFMLIRFTKLGKSKFAVIFPVSILSINIAEAVYREWVKVVSALTGVLGFMLIRFTKLGKSKFAVIFPVSILSINIAEAVYRELEIFVKFKSMQVDPGGIVVLGGVWNILNAIAGILCIVTLTGFAGIKVSKDKSKDMIWTDMTWIYIVGYTLWNFAYVYNCISTRSMYAGLGILLAAVLAELIFKRGAWLQHRAQILALYAMFSLSFDYQQSQYFQIVPVYKESMWMELIFKRGAWLQHRAQILALYAMFSLSFDYQQSQYFQIVPVYKESMWMVISVISFVFNVGMFLYMIYTIKKYKKNPLKEDIYTETNYYKKTLKDNNLEKCKV